MAARRTAVQGALLTRCAGQWRATAAGRSAPFSLAALQEDVARMYGVAFGLDDGALVRAAAGFYGARESAGGTWEYPEDALAPRGWMRPRTRRVQWHGTFGGAAVVSEWQEPVELLPKDVRRREARARREEEEARLEAQEATTDEYEPAE